MATSNSRRPSTGRSPSLAAFLSFCFPGLGQLYTGKRELAAFLGIPTLVIAGFFAVQVLGGILVLGSRLFVPAFAYGIFGLAILFGLWRIVAIVHAFGSAGTRLVRSRPAARGVLAVLILLVVGMHGLVGYDALAFVDASQQMFPAENPTPSPGTTPNPNATDNGASYIDGHGTNPTTPSSRITILLTGIDAYRTRSEALNDSLLVVSYDPVKKTAAMLSVPRDTSEFPLYFGGTYHGKINSLMTWAYLNPKATPDTPVDTLTKEIGFLLGVKINYFAAIDLAHFMQMIDLVGGVDVVNPKPIADPLYDWLDGSKPGFYLSAGPHHLNGRLALAYVRSRQGQGDNDYTRSARQQGVLIALAKKMASPAGIAILPSVLKAASAAIKTDIPAANIPNMVQMAGGFNPANIFHVVLGPPYNYHPDSSLTGGVWTSRLYMDKVKALSIQLFGTDSTYYTAPASPSPVDSPSPSPQ